MRPLTVSLTASVREFQDGRVIYFRIDLHFFSINLEYRKGARRLGEAVPFGSYDTHDAGSPVRLDCWDRVVSSGTVWAHVAGDTASEALVGAEG